MSNTTGPNPAEESTYFIGTYTANIKVTMRRVETKDSDRDTERLTNIIEQELQHLEHMGFEFEVTEHTLEP